VTLAVIVVGAVVVAFAIVFAARLVGRGNRTVRDDRLVEAVDDMRTRMDDLGRDLSEALDRAERESRRNRFLSDLGSSIEFDELLDRILDAALEIPGFDAAMIALEEPSGPPTIATRGMTAEEAAHPPSSGASDMPSGPITVSYRYGPADAANTDLIRGGLFIWLAGREGQSLGTLTMFWRTPGFDPSPARVEALEQIAAACIPAIENARRYREARRLAETDALTGFYNQRYFHETLRREALRAQRYGRRLALMLIDLDDFKRVNDTIGHLAGDAVLAQIAERMRDQIRSVDIGCRIGGDEFAVILPESTTVDAEQLFQRMHDTIQTVNMPGGQHVRISAGIAELQHGETAAGLFERADSALYRAKDLGKDRVSVAPD
jgi:diguanylate cyclase (GGDEF)-like protein